MPATSPVRFVAHFTVVDPDRYRVNEKGFFPILKAHGGRFLTFADDVTVLEGEHAAGRTVLLEFDSDEALRAWWESPEYRELAEHRHASTTTHAVYVVHSPPGR